MMSSDYPSKSTIYYFKHWKDKPEKSGLSVFGLKRALEKYGLWGSPIINDRKEPISFLIFEIQSAKI